MPTYPGMLGPIEEVANTADGVGVISTAPEVDGVVRRVPLLINVQGDLYPNIAIETLRVMMGVPSYQMKTTPYGIHSVRVKGFPINRGIIETDARGRLFLRWNTEIPVVNYTENNLSSVAGKTVIIGLTAEGLGNPVGTPIGEKYPHEIIGSTLSTIILGETVERPMWADLYELVAIFALGLIIVAVVAFAPYWLSAVFIVGVAGGIMYGVGYMFATSSIGPNIPGYVNKLLAASLLPPTILTPDGTPFSDFCMLPVCAITTPLFCNILTNSKSLPKRSGSLNRIGITITPAPFFLNSKINSAILSLGQGH